MAKKTSQEYLAESVLELVSKYYGDRITVVQIAQNCNISTGTFYNYFQGTCYLAKIGKVGSFFDPSEP